MLPALLLNYAGQTSLYLDDPALAGNPFFRLVPQWAIYPMVLLATLATIIASQAIITGTFSMTRQAMQLGWLPGVRIRQTSDEEYGQIYVPFVNWTMMAFTIALTIGFASSDRLAARADTVRRVWGRRFLAATVVVPPSMAEHLNTDAMAVLAVIRNEAETTGRCTLPVARIAERANVGRAKTRAAIRLAQSLEIIGIEVAPDRKRMIINRCVTSRCAASSLGPMRGS